jgi:hypothetical protein
VSGACSIFLFGVLVGGMVAVGVYRERRVSFSRHLRTLRRMDSVGAAS